MVYVRMFLEGQQMRVRPRTTSGPRQKEFHKFAYLMMKNNSFARFQVRACVYHNDSEHFTTVSILNHVIMTCLATVSTTKAFEGKRAVFFSFYFQTPQYVGI